MLKVQIYKWIFSKLLRWHLIGQLDPTIRKSVLIVIPHTSWHDFYIGLLARGIIDLEINYVAKKELFRWPFGGYFRYMGGAPLDRSGNQNKVDAIARVFEQREIFRLAIAPEGTRKKVDAIKSGFYFIALKAAVPIIPVVFDYRKKSVTLGDPFYPSGNYNADLKLLLIPFIGATGKIDATGFDALQYLNNPIK